MNLQSENAEQTVPSEQSKISTREHETNRAPYEDFSARDRHIYSRAVRAYKIRIPNLRFGVDQARPLIDSPEALSTTKIIIIVFIKCASRVVLHGVPVVHSS